MSSEFKFITAREARERANLSEVAAQKWLKSIEPQIMKAADSNEFSLTFHLDCVDVTFSQRLPDLKPEIKGAAGDAEAAIKYCKMEMNGEINHGAMG